MWVHQFMTFSISLLLLFSVQYAYFFYIVTHLINELPGSGSVNTVHYATVEEAVFSACPFS
jgi:hypothetical protein